MNKINRLAVLLSAFVVVGALPGASAFAEMSTLHGTLLGLVRAPTLDSRAPRTTSLEGTVRSIKSNRVVIRTRNQGDVRLFANRSTPITHRARRYSFADLEVGDVVRVSVLDRGGRDYEARSFEVLNNISGNASDAVMDVRPNRSVLSGRVVKINDSAGSFRLDTDNGRPITVNAVGTKDFRRGQNWLYDLHSGDIVEVNGSFGADDVFRATSMKLLDRGQFESNGEFRTQKHKHGKDKDRDRDGDRKKNKDDAKDDDHDDDHDD